MCPRARSSSHHPVKWWGGSAKGNEGKGVCEGEGAFTIKAPAPALLGGKGKSGKEREGKRVGKG